MNLNEMIIETKVLVANAQDNLDDEDFAIFIGYLLGTAARLVEEASS